MTISHFFRSFHLPTIPVLPGDDGTASGPITDNSLTGDKPPPADHQLKEDPTKKKALPPKNTTNTQVGASCVFKTMEWISKFLGSPILVGDIVAQYANSLQTPTSMPIPIAMDLINNGVKPEQLGGLVNMFFNTSSTVSITESIDSGMPLMGSIQTTEVGNAHEVMITGYNNDGSIQYFDPQTGTYSTKPSAADFSLIYTIVSV